MWWTIDWAHDTCRLVGVPKGGPTESASFASSAGWPPQIAWSKEEALVANYALSRGPRMFDDFNYYRDLLVVRGWSPGPPTSLEVD